MKPIATREVVFADDSKVVVSVLRWKGQRRLDVRLHFKQGDEWKATKCGFFGPVGMATELATAFKELALMEEAGELAPEREWHYD